MFGTEVKVVQPDDRRAYIPSDVMDLATYIAFKAKFNANLDRENGRIKLRNGALHESQPKIPELRAYPTDVVLMISPKSFIITLPDFKRVVIPIGVFNCPVELAEHWYMESNGGKAYEHPASPVLAAPAAPEVAKEAPASSPIKNLAGKNKG